MKHRLESDSRLVRGLVLDHGARHPVRALAALSRWSTLSCALRCKR
jgi:hypothetical protein